MIELKGVSKSYKTKYQEVQALKDINLSFDASGLVFILGKSGCGKSTLLNVIGGIDTVTNGEILVNDESITELKQSELDIVRNYNYAFVFQEYNLVDEYNVYENIELALDLQGEQQQKEKITKALCEVGLEGYEKRKIRELSGGQQQRVAIARALVKNSLCILADEPTGNLDSVTGKEIFALLKKISQTKLVIVVSHDDDNAKRFGDRIIKIEDGKVIYDDSRIQTQSENINATITEEKTYNRDNTNNDQQVLIQKKKKPSIKQIFKFASRNMWRRKIRLTAAIILCSLCFGLFGLSLSYTNYDFYSIYAPQADKYLSGYLHIDPNGIQDENSEFTYPESDSKENVEETRRVMGESLMPIYTDGKNYFAVLTDENIKYFPHTVIQTDGRENIVPQNYNEVVGINSYANNVTLCGDKEFNVIAGMRLDRTKDKADLIKYYTDLANKDMKNFDKEEDKEFYRMIQDKDNLNAYVERLLENNRTIINYFVHPDFITQVLPNRSGDQKISFTYKEWINKYEPTDSDYKEFLHDRTSTGYMYNLEMANKYADTIVYLPQYSGKTTLDDNEVLISVEHAKVILGGSEHRLYSNISDEEAIAAIGTGFLNTAMLKLDGKIVNAKIVGYYDRDNNDWLTWNDKDYSSFSASYVGNMHRYQIAPFIVSDRLYNNDKQYDSNAVGYIANFEYLDLDVNTLKYLTDDLSQFSFSRNRVVWQVTYFHSTYKYNSDLVKPVWMYAALFMAILCVIAVLSYVWAVIHDSKRKIGVLRAQGMNSLSIAAIYLIETMVACLIAISIGICLTLLLSNWESIQGFPQKFTVFDFKTNYFGIKEILSVFGFGMGIGVLGSIAPIAFNARKSPVSIIRSKK